LSEVFASTSSLGIGSQSMLIQDPEEEGDFAVWPTTVWLSPVTRQEILQAIPPKDFADSLVAVCFQNSNNEASKWCDASLFQKRTHSN
jgi:hypothetical protein